MISFDPSRQDFSPYGFTCVRWGASKMQRPDHHHEIELNFLPKGWVLYQIGGRQVRVTAGRLTAFWAAIPHQIVDFGGVPEYFVATIPLAWFLQCRLPDRLVLPLLRGEVVSEPEGMHAALDAALFARWVEDLDRRSEETSRAAMLEIEARLLRLARALPRLPQSSGRARPGLATGALSHAERLACFVAQHYREKLRAEDIGKAVGLHPNYAMNLFQKTFGATLGEHLTHHRIAHAQRLLATSDEKIIEVAHSSGFASLSRFNQAFRRACGCSPSAFRARHRAAD